MPLRGLLKCDYQTAPIAIALLYSRPSAMDIGLPARPPNLPGEQMHPVEKYKKIAQELLAKAEKEERRRVRAELKSVAERYLLLAIKTARNSWRYAKAEE